MRKRIFKLGISLGSDADSLSGEGWSRVRRSLLWGTRGLRAPILGPHALGLSCARRFLLHPKSLRVCPLNRRKAGQHCWHESTKNITVNKRACPLARGYKAAPTTSIYAVAPRRPTGGRAEPHAAKMRQAQVWCVRNKSGFAKAHKIRYVLARRRSAEVVLIGLRF